MCPSLVCCCCGFESQQPRAVVVRVKFGDVHFDVHDGVVARNFGGDVVVVFVKMGKVE